MSKLESEQRKVYGEIHNEKNELHLKLIKKEEELKALQRHLEMFKGEKTTWETEKQLGTQREAHLRNRIAVLEDELKKTQVRERELQRNIASVDAATRALQDAADKAREDLTAKLKREKSSRHQSELKRIKTEEFLRSKHFLIANFVLVCQ